jgi:hypothetical protein
MTKEHTVPLTKAQVRKAVVGGRFLDHGRIMVLIDVRQSYQDGKMKVFDTWAMEKQAFEKMLTQIEDRWTSTKKGGAV